jgi:4-alpha-glucanotransferase
MHWQLIRAACASVADTAIVALQDVLGLGSEARMNLPGRDQGYWEWRFDWAQVQPQHAQRLAALCALYGR